jgi:membrane-associated protein
MEYVIELIRWLYSPEGLTAIIQTVGLAGITFIVFAETGLLVGFLLPGDSLLVTAGILACPQAIGGGIFDPITLIACLVVAAIVGDQVNYALGAKAGQAVYLRPDGWLIKRKHFEEAKAFYEARGASAIVIARFVPILRTFVPFVAGVAQMRYRRFVAFNIMGGAGWVVSMVLLGYYLGRTPLAQNLHGVITVVVAISLIPFVVAVFKRWRAGRSANSVPRHLVSKSSAKAGHAERGSIHSASTCG